MTALSFPRRQQRRRLRRARGYAAASVATGVLAVAAGTIDAVALALILALASITLMVEARRWVRLADRSRVGARSEEEVRRALEPLAGEGWRLRHSLTWRGRGDIDSMAIAPTDIAFAIETKTRTYEERHLACAREQAAWLSRRRRRWCRHGALPVVCLAGTRGVEHLEDGVLVVSIDRLTAALRTAAGQRHRPAFLTPA